MSRRSPGDAASQRARHTKDRLSATLGTASAGGPSRSARDGSAGSAEHLSGVLDLTAASPDHPAFEYDGGTRGGPNIPADSCGRPDDASIGAGIRWRLGLRVAVLLGFVSLLAAGWFWWQVAAAHPEVVPLNDVTSSGSGEKAGDSSAGNAAEPGVANAAGQKIVIHVAGAVNNTGVVELPQGSRIHEALAAAGGSTAAADLNRLNLAAVLEDGQKIYVPEHGEAMPAGGSSGGGADPAAGESVAGPGAPAGDRVDLNTAGVEELGTLPRVGPVLAQRIVDWRKEHGPFKTAEELDAVDGVGPKMLETLLPLVRV